MIFIVATKKGINVHNPRKVFAFLQNGRGRHGATPTHRWKEEEQTHSCTTNASTEYQGKQGCNLARTGPISVMECCVFFGPPFYATGAFHQGQGAKRRCCG